VVALIGAFSGLHLAQQRIHFIERQAPVGPYRGMAGEGGEQFVAMFGQHTTATVLAQIAQHIARELRAVRICEQGG